MKVNINISGGSQSCEGTLPSPRRARSTWTSMLSLVFLLRPCASTTLSAEVCAGVRDRLVCDSLNPAVFHVCSGGTQYAMVCPGSLHFNERTQVCDWPETVNCVQEARSRDSAAETQPGQSGGSEYGVSLPSRKELTSFGVTPAPPYRLGSKIENHSSLGSKVNALEGESLDTPGLSPRSTVVTEKDKEKRMLVDEKAIDDASIVVVGFKGVENQLDKPSPDPGGDKDEPYIALYHRKPSSSASQKKSRQLATQRLASRRGRYRSGKKNSTSKPSRPITTSARNRNPTYTLRSKLSTDDTVLTAPKWYQVPELGGDSIKLSGNIAQKKTKVPTKRGVITYQSSLQENQVHRSQTDLSPRDVLKLQDFTDVHIKQLTPEHETRTDIRSNNLKKPTSQDSRFSRASFQSSARRKSSKEISSPSDEGQSRQSISASASRVAQPGVHNTNPSSQYFNDRHKLVPEMENAPSVGSKLKNKISKKRSSRPKTRKNKPRHDAVQGNHRNTKSLQSLLQAPGRDRSMSYKPPVKHKAQSPARSMSSVKSVPAQNKIIPAATTHGTSINAAASLDKFDISEVKSAGENFQVKKMGKCSSSWCKLPSCRCVGADVPGGLQVGEVPQIVMLTFDDSITSQVMTFYQELFNGTFKNPNGCPIKATFFVSGDHSEYDLVRTIFKQGHEVASHTISHRSPTTWWAGAGFDDWEHEVVGMRDRLAEKSGVPRQHINGMRAPFLQVGGDSQYSVLADNKFRYDSSMITGPIHDNNKPPIWPFTLDTPLDRTTCAIAPCPSRPYPGLWEVPLIRWYGSNYMSCAMPDACTADSGTRGNRKLLEDNFRRHYSTNRAPFGIFLHASWFSRTEGSFQALKQFMDKLSNMEDVWLVTLNQALDWVQSPVRLSELSSIESWAC